MARYGDILEVLKDEIRLIRRARLQAAKAKPLVERAGFLSPDGTEIGRRNELSGLPALLSSSEPAIARAIVGDAGDLIELIGDQPELSEVTELCARAVASQIETRARAA